MQITSLRFAAIYKIPFHSLPTAKIDHQDTFLRGFVYGRTRDANLIKLNNVDCKQFTLEKDVFFVTNTGKAHLSAFNTRVNQKTGGETLTDGVEKEVQAELLNEYDSDIQVVPFTQP